jgi:hypothetical protein
MNPEFLVEKLPQIGRFINVIALVTFICAVGLAAANKEEAVALLKAVHTGFTFMACLVVGMDVGANTGLLHRGYPISNEDGWGNPARIQNLVLTGGNTLLGILSKNLR